MLIIQTSSKVLSQLFYILKLDAFDSSRSMHLHGRLAMSGQDMLRHYIILH